MISGVARRWCPANLAYLVLIAKTFCLLLAKRKSFHIVGSTISTNITRQDDVFSYPRGRQLDHKLIRGCPIELALTRRDVSDSYLIDTWTSLPVSGPASSRWLPPGHQSCCIWPTNMCCQKIDCSAAVNVFHLQWCFSHAATNINGSYGLLVNELLDQMNTTVTIGDLRFNVCHFVSAYPRTPATGVFGKF